MKSILKLTLTLVAVFTFGLTAQAQDVNKQALQKEATVQAETISKKMDLTATQKEEIQRSIAKFHVGKAKVENADSNKKGLRNDKKRVYGDFKKEIKSILTPERYADFMLAYKKLN
ncbi:MAG: hypothetical protein L0J45_05900 [Psychroflexus sp.]|nr:hypothetical protein [Psychroflexus sp.]MDN6309893.1 hypothetical protein [Psychroflexus sp.]